MLLFCLRHLLLLIYITDAYALIDIKDILISFKDTVLVVLVYLFTTVMEFCKKTVFKADHLGNIVQLTFLGFGTYYLIRYALKKLDPTKKSKDDAIKKAHDQLKSNGIADYGDFNEYEMVIASRLITPANITVTWEHIAGLDDIIQEIKDSVITPVQIRDLLRESALTQPPKGVLLHGPPGVGKTLVAKAMAREAGMCFINMDLSLLTDKWYGESQKLTAAVFSVAAKLQPCIIFIDEIDSFLRKRNSNDHEATAMMKAQFLTLWDGLVTNPEIIVIVMGATNKLENIDEAVLRRMPSQFHFKLPNVEHRLEILRLILSREKVEADVDMKRLAEQTDGFSGSDLQEVCRQAATYRIRDYGRNIAAVRAAASNYAGGTVVGNPVAGLRAITMKDMMTSVLRMRESNIHCRTLLHE